MTDSRHPKGARTGGQFAPGSRSEPTVSLPPVDDRFSSGPTDPGKRELLGPGALTERNSAWSPAAIKKFLGDPDKEIRNPVFRTGPKMRLFLAERVDKVEATDEWKAWEVNNLRRREASASRKTVEAESELKVEVGSGRNGFYPVVKR